MSGRIEISVDDLASGIQRAVVDGRNVGAADERARCIAVLEALRTKQMNNDFTYWYLVALDDAIDALKANDVPAPSEFL